MKDVLRKAAKALQKADAIYITCGAGMGIHNLIFLHALHKRKKKNCHI
jgi:hypothetical protein